MVDQPNNESDAPTPPKRPRRATAVQAAPTPEAGIDQPETKTAPAKRTKTAATKAKAAKAPASSDDPPATSRTRARSTKAKAASSSDAPEQALDQAADAAETGRAKTTKRRAAMAAAAEPPAATNQTVLEQILDQAADAAETGRAKTTKRRVATAAAAQPPAAPGTDEAAAAAPKRRRSSRAAATPATEPPVAPDEASTTTGGGSEAAPAVAKRSRAKTAKTEPAQDLAALEQALDQVLEAPATGEGEAPPRRAISRRGAKAAASDDAPTFVAAGAPDSTASPDTQGNLETNDDGPASAAPMLLLFQAPEPGQTAKAKAKATTKSAAKPEPKAESKAAAEPEAEDGVAGAKRRRGSRGGRKRTDGTEETPTETKAAAKAGQAEAGTATSPAGDEAETGEEDASLRRRRRRRRTGQGSDADTPTALEGSTRLEAKRQRRKVDRQQGRRRIIITEAEFLARREKVNRRMLVRERDGRTQIAVLEDGVLVEHYVTRPTGSSWVGDVYLGRVQNVLPSMEAAFVDIGKGRNAVLYAGEVNWDAAGLEGQPRRIEQALKSGDTVLVQVTKDPISHKGARLTSQITLAGRYLVLVPGGGMTGISRKLPDKERERLKGLLKEIMPADAGVIVRTAAEGTGDQEIRADLDRLVANWQKIQAKSKTASAPALLKGEPDLAIRVVRDIFNEDFTELVVSGKAVWESIASYIEDVAPELRPRLTQWTAEGDVFTEARVDEQVAKGMDRKVWLPSGGSLIIDKTEAMTVIDVNTGKFTGTGGTLEETVTRNNLEAAEEIARQLRLRDVGGIIVVDFIDMVLESNRDLVLRRLVEALSRDRTRHQVAEVTSLGLVQMTRKRVGQGLLEAFSEPCETCHGRGYLVHDAPVDKRSGGGRSDTSSAPKRKKRGGKKNKSGGRAGAEGSSGGEDAAAGPATVPPASEEVKATLASIAAAAAQSREGS